VVFADLACDAAAGKWVDYEVFWGCEHLDEKFGQTGWESGGMGFQSVLLAVAEVVAVAFGVGNREEVGRDGAVVVGGEFGADVVA